MYEDDTVEQAARRSVRAASPGYAGNQLRLDPAGVQEANRAYMAERLPPPAADAGSALRNQPVQDMSELRSRLTSAPAQPPAVPPRNVPLATTGDTLRGARFTTPVTGAGNAAMYAEHAAANAAPAAAPATAAAAAPATSPVEPGAVARTASRFARVAGPVAAGAGALVEGANVLRVADAPGASGIDVATQGAEGIARLAGGAVGGIAGAAVGGPVGAVIGGAAGYKIADEGIKQLRSLVGLDARSPVDRLPPPPAKPTTQPAAAPANTAATPVQQPLNTSSQPATPRTIAAAAPQYELGKNAVEVIRPGGDRTVETFGANGNEGAVPSSIFNAGQTAQYRATQAQATQDDLSDPKRTLAQERLQQAGATERQNIASKALVESSRVRVEDKVPKPEVLKNLQGEVTGSVTWRPNAAGGFDPVVTPLSNKPKPAQSKALADAKAAIAKGADAAAVNTQLQQWGYPTLNLNTK